VKQEQRNERQKEEREEFPDYKAIPTNLANYSKEEGHLPYCI